MKSRIQVLFLVFLLGVFGIILRLAYWQLIQGPELSIQARDQYTSRTVIYPSRGEIYTADGFPLVINKPLYTLVAYSPNVTDNPGRLVDSILPLIQLEIEDPLIATDEAKRELEIARLKSSLSSDIMTNLTTKKYSVLAKNLSPAEKTAIEALQFPGLSFEESFVRGYPEASMAAQLTGFVGRDTIGTPTGYFGLEGYYNRELTGREGLEKQEIDAIGNPLMIGDYKHLGSRNGRTLTLHLERAVQYLLETTLKAGVERYGAASGEVVVMDPTSGAVLGLASWPNYAQEDFFQYDTMLYKNPAIANTYEPGSTFKVLVMAAALNEGAVRLDDQCDICHGPLTIGKYSIKTWNNEYHPSSTPAEIIANSDNVGMVWTQRKLGGEKMVEYLKAFGIGEKTGIDLQEEVAPSLRSRWGDIDYATTSFGQGIAVTSIEMVRAVSAIANGGQLMEPHVVKSIDDNGVVTPIPPKVITRVISEETAAQMTEIMIGSAEHGDAKWTRLPDYSVAGKTGTAQIPLAGHYDEDKTITSFIGFAPAKNPRFVMLVKLREPTTSQWGSETAAPLWFTLARKLLLHYRIPPDIIQ